MGMRMLTLLLALVAGAAGAQDSDLGGQIAVGKVQRLFVRAADSLYVEAHAEDIGLGRELWADVSLAGAEKLGRGVALALISERLTVERGDLVRIRIARSGRVPAVVAPLAEVNRVLGIAAKHYTLAAAQYGVRAATGSPPAAPRQVTK
jgi:hypothetical protein